MHQLCKTQALTMQLIRLCNDLTFSFISLGNLNPSSANALSMTDLFDARFVLNFFWANDILVRTLYGVIK